MEKCFADFLPFRAPGSSFFWDFLFFDHLSSSLLFSDSSHLCFSSVLIVGSLTSKLPSTICMSTHFNIMLLILHGDSSNIRVRMQLLMRLQHLYEQIKYSRVPRTTDWENLRDTNDKENDNKINPKTSFKHHRPLITPPWRFAPKRDTISLIVFNRSRPKDKNIQKQSSRFRVLA